MGNDSLSRFLERFPTKLDYKETDSDVGSHVFWSQSSSSSSRDDDVVLEKIKSAFCNVNASYLNGLIQFWSLTPGTNGRLLTKHHPFVTRNLDPRLQKYRLLSMQCEYRTRDLTDQTAVARAFAHCFPEAVLHLYPHMTYNAMAIEALDCDLTCTILLPVLYHSTCVGVVECTMWTSDSLFEIFDDLKRSLHRVGLSVYREQPSLRSYQTVSRLVHKKTHNEIEDALQFVCDSHDLPLAQVWIPYNEIDTDSSSFLMKYIDYINIDDSHPLSSIKYFFQICDTLPLNILENGLVGKALQTHIPHFCKNTYNTINDGGLLTLLYATTHSTSLSICLRSIETGDLDYVFEFLWPTTRNCSQLLLEALLLTLKMCLPTFKFPSGAQLGDKLRLFNVDNSGIGSFMIFHSNKLSPTLKPLEQEEEEEEETRRSRKRNFTDFSSDTQIQHQNAKQFKVYSQGTQLHSKMGEDSITCRDQLSTFLSNFPNKIYYKETEGFIGRRVFWSKTESNSKLKRDVWTIHEKIKSAFSDIDECRLKGLIQFWAPVKTIFAGEKRWILSTYDQPFAFEDLDPRLCKYRLFSSENHFLIDHVKDPLIIHQASAFVNHFPEILLDLRCHRNNRFVASALDCQLTSFILLPVFYQTSCVGVVECCMKATGLLLIFNALKSALERVGLNTYHVKECLPYKTMNGLKRATDEIEEALKIVCESHHLALGQVWIANASENRVPFLDDAQRKQMFVVRLFGYRVASEDYDSDDDPIKDYYDMCNVLPLKMGEGLPGKTLQTCEPHFCTSLSKLGSKEGFLGVLSASTKCSCLVLCLRSIDTGDLDYAFEFLWPRTRNHPVVMESLLLKLKMCLSSFKFPSGAQLGDELRLLVFEKSSGCRSVYFEILKGNGLSLTRKVNDWWGGPKHLKQRLINDLSDGENDIDTGYFWEDDDDFTGYFWEDDDDLLVSIYYGDECRVVLFRSSYTPADVKEVIKDQFNLDHETYRLEYESEDGHWGRLSADENSTICRKYWRRIAPNSRFNLHVVHKSEYK